MENRFQQWIPSHLFVRFHRKPTNFPESTQRSPAVQDTEWLGSAGTESRMRLGGSFQAGHLARCGLLCRAKPLQSCLTLCDPMDCSPPGSSVHGDSPGEDTEVGCHCLLHLSIFNKIPRREFPGGPVVKTQCFQCSGLGSTPGGETTILCPPPQKKNPRHWKT